MRSLLLRVISSIHSTLLHSTPLHSTPHGGLTEITKLITVIFIYKQLRKNRNIILGTIHSAVFFYTPYRSQDSLSVFRCNLLTSTSFIYRVGQTQLGSIWSLIINQSNYTRENGKVPFVADRWQRQPNWVWPTLYVEPKIPNGIRISLYTFGDSFKSTSWRQEAGQFKSVECLREENLCANEFQSICSLFNIILHFTPEIFIRRLYSVSVILVTSSTYVCSAVRSVIPQILSWQ
jgi:hypothetical protein